jgi:hypothetical protein
MLSQARKPILAALAILVSGTAACSWPSSAKSPSNAPAATVQARRVQVRSSRPRAQVMVVQGLMVSMAAPPSAESAPVGGHYQIFLRAKNSTSATMTLPVVGNPPRMLSLSGDPVTGVTGATGFGPGARRQNDLQRGAKSLRPQAGKSDALPPGAYVTGVLTTNFNPAGHHFVVKWDFGAGRAAAFQLP